MGGQLDYWGLWIDAGFEFGSCSPTCSTYAGYKMLSGSPEFGIAGVEVWCAEGIYGTDENEGAANSVIQFLKKEKNVSLLKTVKKKKRRKGSDIWCFATKLAPYSSILHMLFRYTWGYLGFGLKGV